MTAPGFANVTPNQPFGVEHVTFSVAAGTASGLVPVSIVVGNNTSIGVVNGSPLVFSPTNGSINVNPSPVPEPSSIVCMAIAGISLSLVQYSRRRILGLGGTPQFA